MIKESVIPRIAVNTPDLLFSHFRAFRREPLHRLVELVPVEVKGQAGNLPVLELPYASVRELC